MGELKICDLCHIQQLTGRKKMPEMYLRKAINNSLIPCEDNGGEFVRRLNLGDEVRCKVSKPRNIKFHRKFFALLDYAFDCWEPSNVEVPQFLVHRGLTPQKNKERFRKDIIILAGFYDTPSISLKGDVRLEAKSMSFANMSEEEFGELYSKVIDVVLQKILTNYSEDELKTAVDGLMEFS